MVLPVGGTSVVSRKTRGSSGERPQAGPTRSVRSASNPGTTPTRKPISPSLRRQSVEWGELDELPQFLRNFPQPATRGWVSHDHEEHEESYPNFVRPGPPAGWHAGRRSTIVGLPPSAVPNFAKSLIVGARRGFSDAARRSIVSRG